MGHSQILNAERFGRNVDSADVFKGNVNLSYSGARRVALISNFKAGADFSLRWKKSEFISSGAYSWLLKGNEQIRNEGFFHVRYRLGPYHSRIVPETFTQLQRDAVLGLNRRFIAGQNVRFTLQKDSLGLVYFGIGGFFENEVWDFSGVPDADDIPADAVPRETQFIKANIYLSARREISRSVDLGAVVYYQARPDAFFLYPRIASDITLNFKISQKLGWRTSFSSMYDRRPVVPIYAFYFSTFTGITLDIN